MGIGAVSLLHLRELLACVHSLFLLRGWRRHSLLFVQESGSSHCVPESLNTGHHWFPRGQSASGPGIPTDANTDGSTMPPLMRTRHQQDGARSWPWPTPSCWIYSIPHNFHPKLGEPLFPPRPAVVETKGGHGGPSHWTTQRHWLKGLDSQVLLSHPHSPLKTWFLFRNLWVLCCLKHSMADAFSTGECLCLTGTQPRNQKAKSVPLRLSHGIWNFNSSPLLWCRLLHWQYTNLCP